MPTKTRRGKKNAKNEPRPCLQLDLLNYRTATFSCLNTNVSKDIKQCDYTLDTTATNLQINPLFLKGASGSLRFFQIQTIFSLNDHPL
jgi:hypothetical protein